MKNYLAIKKCPITGDGQQIKYFDLGNIPLVNNLCETREESINAERFPLDVNYYPASGESSLGIAIDSEILFSRYLFKSEVNKPYYAHCKDMFNYLQNYITVEDEMNILDIGGNDGTLLNAFRNSTERKLNLLNIDASKNIALICESKGIPCLTEFFSFNTAKTITKKFKVIASTNVFQHLLDIHSFSEGVEFLLDQNGIWVLEFPYWIHDMKTNQFDQVYHEHIYYHSVTPIKMIVEKHAMKIINISRQVIHGGTLRFIIAKEDSNFTCDSTIENFLEAEKNYDSNYYLDWGKNIKLRIEKSKDYIKEIKKRGYTIYGFGAAAKGCIYLNAMKLDYRDIDYVIDDTDIKQGKFIPGTGIQVVSRSILKEKKPDFILILAHNFADYIIESLKSEYQGKFIVLIPEIKEI